MKKISLFFAGVVAVLSFNSCSETWDDNPVLSGVPEGTTFRLNTPTMADNVVLLEDGGSLHMTCNQPDYGYQAPVSYQVQVSLTEDFAKFENIRSIQTNRAQINPPCDQVANAACKLLGVVEPADVPGDVVSLWFRVRAYISQSPDNTTCFSNPVEYKKVQIYYNISIPGKPSGLFIRGGMNDWGAPADGEFLTTDEMGIYQLGPVTIAKGTEFKVSTADWALPNLGKGSADLKIDQPYLLTNDGGSGNLVCPADFTGTLKLEDRSGKYYLTLIPSKKE